MPVPAMHIIIPDTQVKPGVQTAHLGWIGQYIVDHAYGHPNVKIIHLGDHWDLPSLSSYDKGKKAMEGRRVRRDILAGNDGILELDQPLIDKNKGLTKKWKPKRKILLRGNHENRITRATEDDAQLDGLLTLDDLKSPGWEVIPFLDIVNVDGVSYSHYFYNPMTGRPYAGANLETRLKTVGHSFTMGHQQGYKFARVDTVRGSHLGLVAGSAYIHEEDYLGPQTINYWRGIVVCHQVENGEYDPMFVSLDYLCRRYAGVKLSRFKVRHYA